MRESDAKLVQRALGGDSEAFDKLVERYRSRTFRLALSKVHMREEAVDIAQEAFVRAFLSLGTLSDPDKFAPWLMAITANTCKMRLRKTQEIPLPVDVVDGMYAATPRYDSVPMREMLSRLPEKTRVAALLFFIEGLKQSDISARLGISLPAVKARIHQARLRLQKEMIGMSARSNKNDELGEEFTSSMKHKLELARWYREFAEELESGGSVMTGLGMLSKGNYSAPLAEAAKRMMSAIEAGSSITDALAEIPALASRQASALIHAGELVGSLHIAARVLADWMEVQDAQRRIELIFWCRTFGYLLAGGVSIKEALNYGLNIAQGKALQQATREMVDALEKLQGKQPTRSPLRPVLDRYSDIFPPILRAAILAGEWAGALNKAIMWAADEMADDLAGGIARSLVPESRELSPRRFGVDGAGEVLPEPCVILLSDSAPDIRSAAIDILGRLGRRDAAPEILARVDDDSAEVRKTAMRTIAQLSYKEAEEALVRHLSDADPTARRTAIEAITKLELHSAARAVAEAITDSDHRVVISAIDSLQALGETDVMKQKAVELFNSESWEDQKRAAYLLRYYLPKDAVQELLNPLGSGIELMSLKDMNAVIALGLYGCTDAKPILEAILGDARCAEMAARALEEVGDDLSSAAIRAAIKAGKLDKSFTELADKLEKKLAQDAC